MSREQFCLHTGSWSRPFAPVFFVLAVLTAAIGLPAEASWTAVGPAGGDARSFATVPGHPNHLYLGTTTSWIYESNDGGASWQHLARLDGSDNLVIDNIVVDSANSSRLYVAAFRPDHPGGGLWISHDAGRSWDEAKDLHGQSIYAFAQAPSDGRILFAGTLEGVFRSSDSGATWSRISPRDNREIHEVESLAVDPTNPEIVYAGTWHLPWKTTDGGKDWHSIRKGLIEDSDVFSIIVDPIHPHTIFLSACSGIYKSENSGELFHKIHGIPSEARRTRVLMQDPTDRKIVYAGTTEGLYKTVDSGRTFERMTGADVIVNDVRVDPENTKHVLLATDRGGVLASFDAGATFVPSNMGFSGRKVEALLVDRNSPLLVYAGTVNDKEFGSVFVSRDGGAQWAQLSAGLDGRDVYSLAQARDGSIVAGTTHGIFVLEPNGAGSASDVPQESIANARNSSADAAASSSSSDPPALVWQPRNTIANTIVKAAVENLHGKRINIEKQVKEAPRQLDSKVNALDLWGDAWLAATSGGLFTSRDQGATWQGGPVMGAVDYFSVTALGSTLAAASGNGVLLSTDGGLTWSPMRIPAMLTRIHRVAFAPDGTLWLGAREGVYFTRDQGKTWMWIERLPFRDVDDLSYDARLGRVLVSSRTSDQIYAIDPKSLDWKWWQTGFPIALIRAAGERLIAASVYDGVVVEPQPAGPETSQR